MTDDPDATNATLEPLPGQEVLSIGDMAVGVPDPEQADKLEPGQFFKILKAGTQTLSPEDLANQISYLEVQLKQAEALGQTVLLKKLKFTSKAVIRERVLHEHGLTEFVEKDAIDGLIGKVATKGTVQIIELARYQRLIPPEAAAQIARVQEKGLFDDYLVLFTNLTEQEMETPEAKAFKQRNRDPIVLGYFTSNPSMQENRDHANVVHNRLYHVASWDDDHCDLTWQKLITMVPSASLGQIDDSLVGGVVRLPDVPWYEKGIVGRAGGFVQRATGQG